jgi:hypothetical protein
MTKKEALSTKQTVANLDETVEMLRMAYRTNPSGRRFYTDVARRLKAERNRLANLIIA